MADRSIFFFFFFQASPMDEMIWQIEVFFFFFFSSFSDG